MKKNKTISQWFKERFVLEFYNEWEQVYARKKFNWYTGTFIHAYFEYEHFGFSGQFVLFGFGFYFRYNTDKSIKLFKKWQKELEKMWKQFELEEKKTVKLKKGK